MKNLNGKVARYKKQLWKLREVTKPASPKYYTVTYCKHIHERRLFKAFSKEEAIELAMSGSGGMVDESSIDCFQILKKDYDKNYA